MSSRVTPSPRAGRGPWGAQNVPQGWRDWGEGRTGPTEPATGARTPSPTCSGDRGLRVWVWEGRWAHRAGEAAQDGGEPAGLDLDLEQPEGPGSVGSGNPGSRMPQGTRWGIHSWAVTSFCPLCWVVLGVRPSPRRPSPLPGTRPLSHPLSRASVPLPGARPFSQAPVPSPGHLSPLLGICLLSRPSPGRLSPLPSPLPGPRLSPDRPSPLPGICPLSQASVHLPGACSLSQVVLGICPSPGRPWPSVPSPAHRSPYSWLSPALIVTLVWAPHATPSAVARGPQRADAAGPGVGAKARWPQMLGCPAPRTMLLGGLCLGLFICPSGAGVGGLGGPWAPGHSLCTPRPRLSPGPHK